MSDAKQDWSRDSLLELLSQDSQEQRLERLRRLGVLDADNEVAPMAKNWGERLSHTAVEDDDAAE